MADDADGLKGWPSPLAMTHFRIYEALQRYDDSLALIGGCEQDVCLIVPGTKKDKRGCLCWINNEKARRVMRAAALLRQRLELVAMQAETESLAANPADTP